MSLVIAALVRVVVLAGGIAGYYALVPVLLPDDDGLGAGLIAFALIAFTAFVWSAVDGRRRGAPEAIGLWAVVSVVVAAAWSVGLALTDDSATSLGERLTTELSSMPFTVGLVLVPATVGAALGMLTRRAR